MRECWVCLAPAPQLPSPTGAGLRRQVPGLPQTRHPRRALGCRVKAASGASPRWWRPPPLSGAESAGRRGPDRPAQPRPSRSCGLGAVGEAKAIAARRGRCPAPTPRAAAGRGAFRTALRGAVPGRRGRRASRGAGQGRGHAERPCAFGPCALSVRFYRPMSRSGSPGGLCRGPWPHRPRRPRDRNGVLRGAGLTPWRRLAASFGPRKRPQGFGGGAGGGAKPSEIKTITPCRLVSSTVFLNN